MTLPRDLVFNREKVYGSIIFIFIFFPFITHIYSAIFPAFYDFNVMYIAIPLVIIATINIISKGTYKVSKDIIFFSPLVVSLIFSFLVGQNNDLFKYLSYIYIYFFLIREKFLERYYFHFYTNLVVFSTFILLFIYLWTNYYINEIEYVNSLSHLSE